METRPVGRTGLRFSVVGFGTAQLQMVPKRQAIDTLMRGIELGVNWIHTAPDYGAIEPWIAEAIERSGREVMVLSAAPGQRQHLGPFFEQTCHAFKSPRLALYGLAGIDDLEWCGENVWGPGGMIEYLQARKAEGRLGGIYCSTHGDADYVARLIESGAFDAIMLAWNPLGFHMQSQAGARAAIGRTYEHLGEYRERIFPLAAARGVGLLVMKPFAGGLLCRGKAFPPHDWYGPPGDPVAPADVLRVILEEPGVCAVVPGAASVEEADENARAGHAPLFVSTARRARLARAVESLRTSICSRCGACESTCSHTLPIAAMFRDAYIWTARNETVQANPSENYFDRHPAAVLTCATCTDRSCLCPQGIDIPAALARVHVAVHRMRGDGHHPGPTAAMREPAAGEAFRARVHTTAMPSRLGVGAVGVASFLVENLDDRLWLAPQHTPDPALAVVAGVRIDGRLTETIPLRNTVHPGERSPVAFEFQAPRAVGRHTIECCLTTQTGGAGVSVFHSGTLLVDPPAAQTTTAPTERRPHTHGADYLDHSIPPRLSAGETCGVRVTLENTGTLTWRRGQVELLVNMDGRALAIVQLPCAEVPAGAPVTLHLALRAPETVGRHRVRIELADRDAGAFAHQGVEPLIVDLAVDAARSGETARLFEIARNHNPWYYNPTNGIGRSRDGHPYPLFVARAKGCRIWDVDGEEFLDYSMGWGSTLLGHADDRIQAAIRDVLDTGAVVPFPSPLEMDVTQMLVEDWPSAEMVVFGKNGSDVCTVAARLARLTTGKTTILSCGFHGWQDFALDYFTMASSGIPDRPGRSLHKFTFNDRAEFLALYDRCKDDLAAVLIEPAGALISPEAGIGSDADPAFLRLIADAARRAGALVIFDEIVTGYRYPQGSVQKTTGVIPDLTCLGKALASGMPLSALVGRSRIFLDAYHKTHYCPTFKAEVYSLAAARAAIGIYRSEPVAAHIWRYGEALRAGIHDVCRQTGIAAECTGPPFRMGFVFRERDPDRCRLKRTLLVQELLKARVVTVLGMMLPSAAHGDAELAATVAAFARALDVVAHAERQGALERYVEIPPL